MIIGGLSEDMINVKNITYKNHPYITLNDLGYNQESEISATSKHGFIIKESISTYETAKDLGLTSKEYTFRSKQQALDYIDYLIQYPYEVISTKIEKQNDLYYGYYEDSLNTILIHKNNHIIIVTCSEHLNDKQIQTIKNFYQ